MKKNHWHLFKEFFLIGCTAFGGHMALIALVRDRLKTSRSNINDSVIQEGIALASIVPGPLAVNVIAYAGYTTAGALGAVIAAVAVLLPAFLLMLLLAWLYARYQTVFHVHNLTLWLNPVVAAIILSVAWQMFKKTIKSIWAFVIFLFSVIAMLVFPGYFVTLIVLACAGFLGVYINLNTVGSSESSTTKPSFAHVVRLIAFSIALAIVLYLARHTQLGQIAVRFSTVSLTLFGGGYVMVPMLKSLLVDQLGWLTAQDFFMGISLGQLTPGPILVSATFFGFQIAGLWGALVATVAIFFPSAMVMVLLANLVNAIKTNPVVQAALMGVNWAVIGLIFSSGISVFQSITGQNLAVMLVVAVVAFVLIIFFHVKPAWLVLGALIFSFLL